MVNIVRWNTTTTRDRQIVSCSLVCVSHTSFQLSPPSSAGGERRERGASGISSASVMLSTFRFAIAFLFLPNRFVFDFPPYQGKWMLYWLDSHLYLRLQKPQIFGIFGRFIRICFRGLPYKRSMCWISDLCAEFLSYLYAQLISNLVTLACKRTASHGIFCWRDSILPRRFITRDCLLL